MTRRASCAHRDRLIGFQLREQLAVAALLVLALFLRLVALDKAPPGPSYDELQNARLSERVLGGERAIYFAENFGQEPAYACLAALAVRLLGWSVVVLRLPGALLGVLSVLALCLVGRRLMGLRAGLLAGGFQAVSFWPLVETRVALETSLLPPLAGLAMLFLTRGLEGKGRPRWRVALDFGLAGLFVGGPVYAYTAGRVMPLLPLALLAYLLVVDRCTLCRHWPELALLCVVVLAVGAPLALFLHAHPEAEQRLDQLRAPLTALRQGDLRPVVKIAAGTLGMFSLRGEPQWLYNVADRPVFDPVTSVFFYVGLLICLCRLRDWRYGLILLWLVTGLGPALVSPPAGSFTHALVAQPAIYLVLGVGMAAAWEWLACRRPWAGALLVVLFLVFNLALSCWAYFVVWANAPQVRELYQGGVSAVARELDGHDPPGPVVVGAPYVNYWQPWNAVGFDLVLRREDLNVRWFNPDAGWVWPSASRPTTFYFPTDPLGRQSFDPALETVFAADAVPLPGVDGEFTSFEVARPRMFELRVNAAADTFVAWPPELASRLPPILPVVFGGRFALLGAEVDKVVQRGGELRLTTYWEVLRADTDPLVAFAHLTSDGQDIWGQHDGLGVRPASLRPGDHFAQVHLLPVRSETPTGIYHVQVGLYSPETLVRLHIATGGGGRTDRVWVGEVQVVAQEPSARG